MNRREFCKSAAGLGAAALAWRPSLLGATGELSKFTASSLVYDGVWNPRPSALRRLMLEVGRRTSIAAAFEPRDVGLVSPELFSQPFLYWAGTSSFPPFEEAALMRLRRFVTAGGFVLVDSAQEAGTGFLDDVNRELARAFPANSPAKLPSEHVIYKTFYMLRGAVGRIERGDRLEAIEIDGRAAVVISPNDLGGAWARDPMGNWEYPVTPGGETQRELAYRMGVNIVMYSLCLDYKDDQVHVPFVLRRRKR